MALDQSPRSPFFPPWLKWLPFVANAPTLTQQQWQLLGLVAFVALFGNYGAALLSLALPQIQAELSIPAAQMSNLGALIRMGALPAFLLTLAADRLGRRQLLIFSTVAFSLLTGATAFVPDAAGLVALQFLVRTFVTAASLLAGVMIVEEFPESGRGWGIGTLTALGSVGGGLAALLFALVNLVPFGWRALYVLGLLGLVFSFYLRRHLRETVRFQTQTLQPVATAPARSPSRPLVSLIRAYPGRFLVIGAIIFLVNLGEGAALFYDAAYLQQAHGWQPWQIALLNLSAGFMAVLGSAMAGQLSDRFGRKRATVLFLITAPLGIIGYFNGAGWWLPLGWAAFLFTNIGASVALSTMRAELFPTSYRSTAAGAAAVLATLGGALSLALHGQIVAYTGSPWSAINWLALFVFLAPLLVIPLPETSGRTLEEIAPER